jgi:ABC-type bacteriocin/lantibiotic exporter with double-glycine peptidase domain
MTDAVFPERGFGATLACRRLLTAMGLEAQGSHLSVEPDQEAIADGLEHHGLLARWAVVPPKGVKSLRFPTLMALPDGSYLVLHRVRRRWLEADGPDGPVSVHLARLPVSTYLEITPDFPAGGLWKCLTRIVFDQRRAFLPILWTTLLVQVLALAAPQLTRIMVDRAFPEGARSMFSVILAASAALGLYRAWIGWLQGRLEVFLEARLAFLVEQGLLARIVRLPYAWVSQRTVGDLLQGFIGIGSAKDLLTGQVLGAGFGLVSAIGCLGMMCASLPSATAWVAIGTLMCSGGAFLAGLLTARIHAQAISVQVKERGLLVEMLTGIGVIKASGAEGRLEDGWLSRYRRRKNIELKGQQVSLASNGILEVTQVLLLQGATLWGGWQVLQGHLTLGELLAFTMLAANLQQAVTQAGAVWLQVVSFQPQMERIREILAIAPEPRPMADPAGPVSGTIRVHELGFQYRPGGPWALQHFNLTLEPEERVVLQGPSGGGKSTLLKLMAGLYRPQTGSIRYGGMDPIQARRSLAYLPQFVHLFHGSILENLHILSGGAPRKALLESAERTGLAFFAKTLPMGFETIVTAGGTNFSGGQRQMMALTAVVASSRSVLLLDEAMANLDPLARGRLFMSDIFQGRTVVLASHEHDQGKAGTEARGFRRIRLGDRPNRFSRDVS